MRVPLGMIAVRLALTDLLERAAVPMIDCAPAAACFEFAHHEDWNEAARQWFRENDPHDAWHDSDPGWLRLFAVLAGEESASCV